MDTTQNLTFRSPRALWKEARSRMADIPQEVLFNDSQYGKLREQWCAGVFGVAYRRHLWYCEVAVNDVVDSETDFFVKANGLIFPFQVVEALEPGRKRGQQYRDRAAGRMRSIPYEPQKGSAEGIGWICGQIGKKAAKRYSGAAALSLLVYTNFNANGLRHDLLVDAATVYRREFLSIWIITSHQACSLHSHDERLGSIPGWLVLPELRDI